MESGLADVEPVRVQSEIDSSSANVQQEGWQIEAGQEVNPPAARLFSFHSIILLGALPFINICGYTYVYTALPLHFVERDWPLWQLSLILSLCYVPRMVFSAMTVRVGDWTVVCSAVINVVLSVWMATEPNNLVAVWMGIMATSSAVGATAYRSLVYRSYNTGWEQQRALRWFTLSDTVGYSCGTFIGGVIYEFGGFSACAWFQVVSSGACILMCLSLKEVRSSFFNYWSRTCKSQQCDTKGMAEEKSGEALPFGPVSMILMATGVNIGVYAIEWCLYAIYFSSVYGWTGSLIGATQMAGDLLGSLMIASSTVEWFSGDSTKGTSLPECVVLWFRAPMGVASLFLGHSALLIMLAQSHFGVALAGQIGMGTVYVFNEQFIQEMLLLYSFGSHKTYQKLVVYHYGMFCVGCAVSAVIAINLYEAVGFSDTFYASAALAGLTAMCFGVFFALRLSGTQTGLGGGLALAEQELRHLHSGDLGSCSGSNPPQSLAPSAEFETDRAAFDREASAAGVFPSTAELTFGGNHMTHRG